MYRESKNVDVLFYLEHKDRELEVITEIAKRLKQLNGHSVALASIIYDRLTAPLYIRPKILVVPSYGMTANLFWEIYSWQITYLNLNWEQMLSSFNKQYRKPRNKFAKNVLKHCAWGNEFRDFLISSGVQTQNIYLTGKPAINLLIQKAYSSFEIREFIATLFKLKKSSKWLFFPMTCLHAFFDDYHVKSFISDLIDKNAAFARRDYVSKTIDIIFQWLASTETYARENDISIVLRPHPSVSIEKYKKRFRNVVGYVPRHLLISKDLTAQEWILASDACFTNYSSLALDAYAVNKPAFLLEPEPFPKYLAYDWFGYFPKIKNFKEFNNVLFSLLNESHLNNQAKIFSNIFDISKNGITETATIIDKLISEKHIPPKPSFNKLFKFILKNPRQNLGSLIRKFSIDYGFKSIVKDALRNDYFNSAEIENLLNSDLNKKKDYRYITKEKYANINL